jgi:hypothetical protein
VLREAGLLAVRQADDGEHLDLDGSRAFAMVDHQFSHVFVADGDEQAIRKVAELFRGRPGIAEVLVGTQRGRYHLDHARSGEVILISTPRSWQAYYWWLSDDRAPRVARTVDIHRKPGYDPVELFVDPRLALPRLRIAATLARKMLGFRYLMQVIGTDASIVRGSHGRLPDRAADGPVFLCTDAAARRESLPMTDVRDTLLDLVARG